MKSYLREDFKKIKKMRRLENEKNASVSFFLGRRPSIHRTLRSIGQDFQILEKKLINLLDFCSHHVGTTLKNVPFIDRTDLGKWLTRARRLDNRSNKSELFSLECVAGLELPVGR
jgi:hypothetical protein